MKEFKKYASFISLGLLILAFIMLFIPPALFYEMPIIGNVDVKEPAFKIIFGLQDPFNFNILGFIGVLLLVAGAILPFLKLDEKPKHIIAAIALVIAGILLFVFPSTIQVSSGNFSANVSFSVGFPVIVAGILGIVAAVVNLAKAVAWRYISFFSFNINIWKKRFY